MRAFKLSNLRFSGLSKYQLHQVAMHPWQVTETVMPKSLRSFQLLCRNSSKVKLQFLSFAELSIFSIYCHSKNSLSLSLICSWCIKWRCMLHFTSVCYQYSRVGRKRCLMRTTSARKRDYMLEESDICSASSQVFSKTWLQNSYLRFDIVCCCRTNCESLVNRLFLLTLTKPIRNS